MMNFDISYLQLAFKLALKAQQHNEVPVGAIIVKDNRIIGRGFNHSIGTCDPTAHAEMIALRNAAKKVGNYRLLNCTLYTTLEPCAMCAGAMIHSRIQRLVFGAFDPKSGAAGSVINLFESKASNHRVQISSGMLQLECGAILSNFFQEKRNKEVI